VQGVRINLKFADDIELHFPGRATASTLQDVSRLQADSEKYGMHINAIRLKTMVFRRRIRNSDAIVCMC